MSDCVTEDKQHRFYPMSKEDHITNCMNQVDGPRNAYGRRNPRYLRCNALARECETCGELFEVEANSHENTKCLTCVTYQDIRPDLFKWVTKVIQFQMEKRIKDMVIHIGREP